MTTWIGCEDADALATEAARLIRAAAAEAIARHGHFRLVLAGGTTPLATYRLLTEQPEGLADWHLYYGDERCLPADDPQRNASLVAETGLPTHASRHHPIPAEACPEGAAVRYTATITPALPFDLVLLGMGEDGHTASLFPGHHWPDQPVIPVENAPKPPSRRVSLGPTSLRACRQMLVLVSGEGKEEALRAWRAGEDLPVTRVADLPQARVLVERNLLETAP
ncbi:6-phosphogluconolactonase [endosymbiont of unidentified scaly snail isolate Monju]|uniref:6-phosphogluconolactonase n=1 Tax=endosymbiont of unidentified scaly snail isolate Monju TaxID=1248727 RepID=UPI0003891AD7|nr:6-phosphogluconolactonase [endosymbiont of unidentified scaly snail isolate Monju]BAN70080.1 6-phosphogluconolactonase [endosymbiont of unidentified scaly snail isolate Monju]